MESYLIQHALDTIWCEPIQDRQAIIQPARHTPNGGTLKFAIVGWEYVPVPEVAATAPFRYFHVYQIGQIHPDLLNITNAPNVWVNAVNIIGAYNVTIDVTLDNGAKVPLCNVYFRVGLDKNVLMAVLNVPTCDFGTTILSETTTAATLDNSAVSVRFYSNAWYQGGEFTASADAQVKPVQVTSRYIGSNNDYQNFRALANSFYGSHADHGAGLYFRDGFVVSTPGAFTNDLIGKYFTYVYDDSVKEVAFFPVTDLQAFNSSLDGGQSKYILFRGKSMDTIDYVDDIDVYLIKRTGNSWKGIYVDRKDGNELRNLTHNAYALKTSVVQEAIDQHTLWDSVSEVEVMLVVRQGGLKRGLVHQANRIEELYKLTEEQILGAMSGLNALLPEWQAAQLENSAYVRLMGMSSKAIMDDPTTVIEAYGYNAATEVMNRNVIPVYQQGIAKYIDIPPALEIPDQAGHGKRAVFVYDGAGKLLGYFNQQGTNRTIPIPSTFNTAATAEVFHGTLGAHDGTYMNMDVVNDALKQFGFRCYTCPIVGGSPSYIWQDVTLTSTYYTYYADGIPGNATPRLVWDHDALAAAGLYPCVKIADKVHVYEVPLTTEAYPGFVRFSVNATSSVWSGAGARTNATTRTDLQNIQPATVDVFMDDLPLIEGIDYAVVWPRIVISRKPNRRPDEGLKVMVRTMGHCDPVSGQRSTPREVGFVRGGVLSVDGQYDIRNDRNIRIVVAGALKRKEQVRFAEDDTGPLSTDGRPYSISDYVNRIEPYTAESTLELRAMALATDDDVQGYLDLYLEETTPADEVIVGDRWQLYSPFCSGIIHALNEGFLDNGELDGVYDNLDIQAWLAPYEYLLDFDPCVQNVNTNYVSIAPHQYATTMTLTQKQYAFVERVIQQYLGNKVDLTPYVQIAGT